MKNVTTDSAQATSPTKRKNWLARHFLFISTFILIMSRCHNAEANLVCTQNMTPVEVNLESPNWKGKSNAPDPVRINIPQSYINYPSELWKGGTYELMMISIDITDMSPACKKHSRSPLAMFENALYHPDTSSENVIRVTVHPARLPKDFDKTGYDPIGKSINSDLKRYNILLKQDENGFSVYKRPLGAEYERKHGIKTLLIPKEHLLQNKVHLICNSIIGKEKYRGCDAHTYEDGIVRYTFHFRAEKWLDKFPEIELKIRQLINQFLLKE